MGTQAGEKSRWLKSREYFPEDRVSYSVLKELDNSPADALYRKQNPIVATTAMQFGKAVDACLFGSTEIIVCVHDSPESGRTKGFRTAKEEYMAENPDGIYLTQEHGDTLDECVTAVKSNPLFLEWLGQEGSQHGRAGVLVEDLDWGSHERVKQQNVANIIDCVTYDIDDDPVPTSIIDLKCVADIMPHRFRNQVDWARWDIQAASYVRMVEEIEGIRVPFYWFVVRNSAPWTCAIYEMDSKWLDASEHQLVDWIHQWHAWKNEPIDGIARIANNTVVKLVAPVWRT
jgi:hypothetical protein